MKRNDAKHGSDIQKYPFIVGRPMHKSGPRFSYAKQSFRFHKDVGTRRGGGQPRGVLVNFVASRRLELGLTQRMLAKLTGVSARTVNRIETNQSEPSVSLAFALAEALERPVQEIFEIRKLRRY